MKSYVTIFAFALGLASCTNDGDKKIEKYEQNKEYCFLLTEGNGGEDTTAVYLTVNADKVSGEMNWIPKEKDSRRGTLTGTISGDEISAVWSFMQEGVKDSINLAFKLSSQELAQKPLKADTINGRLETDASAGYTLLFKPGNCSQSK